MPLHARASRGRACAGASSASAFFFLRPDPTLDPDLARGAGRERVRAPKMTDGRDYILHPPRWAQSILVLKPTAQTLDSIFPSRALLADASP